MNTELSCPVCGSHVELQDLEVTANELVVFEEEEYGCMEVHTTDIREFKCLEGHQFFINPTEA